MAVTPITGFDLTALIDAGLAAETAADQVGGWHEPDGYWHASALTMCPRRQVLWQAGYATDGTPRSGAMNFQLGHAIHDRIEKWAEYYGTVDPRFELVAVEVGGSLPTFRLKARCDFLFRWEGELVLAEIKSERSQCPICKRGGAKQYRVEEAKAQGFPTAIKKEHWVQGTATVMCLEPLYGPIKQGRALYWGKNDMLMESVPFSTDDQSIREWIASRCGYLTGLYDEYQATGSLPVRIAPGTSDEWQCRPRGPRDADGDARYSEKGLYCPARSVCMSSNG